MDAAPEWLRGLGRAPGLADDAPAGPPNSGRRLRWRRAAPAAVDLLRLPEVMPEAIATSMEPMDRAMLASSQSALRHSLPGFSTSDRAAARGRQVNSLVDSRAVLQDVRSLPERPDLQARPLAVQAGQVEIMSLVEQPGAFQRVLRAQEPPGPQADGLRLLAGRMEDLPEAARQQVFTQVLQWAAQLGPGLLKGLAGALVGQLQVLPLAGRQAVFQQALHSISLLEHEHRGPLLGALAKAIAALPQAARLPEWQATLQAVEQLPPPQGVFPLAILADQMGGLPVDARAAAFESVLQAHHMLPVQYHGLSVEVLGAGCLALPRAQWPNAIDRVLGESAWIPRDVRRSSVLGLAIKFCWAEPAANGPIDPLQPDNPGLDVRLQCLDKVLELMPPPPHPSAEFLPIVSELNTQMTQRLQQRPDDAAFLTGVLDRIRRLSRHVQPAAGRDDSGETR